MDVKAITEQIRRILTAPNVDLATVSSKKVRKELAETFGATAIKENKEAIDALIIDSFNHIATAAGATQPAPPSQPEQQVKAEQSTYATSDGIKVVEGASSNNKDNKQRDRIKQQQPDSEEEEDGDEEEDNDDDDDGSDYESEPRNNNSKKVNTPAKSHHQSNGYSSTSKLKESPQKKKLAAAASMDSLAPSSSPSMPLSLTLGAGLTDEEYARQLQAELNRISGGRSTRGSATSSRSNKSKSKSSSFNKKGKGASDSGSGTGKRYRSKAYIDDSDLEGEGGGGGGGGSGDDDDDDGSDEAPKKKRRSGGGGGNSGGGYNKELLLSEPLSRVCGVPTMSRPKIVKRLWEYIRENNLQDPNKRSDILNDDLFKEIFGVEKMTMFSMNKYLTKAVKPIDG